MLGELADNLSFPSAPHPLSTFYMMSCHFQAESVCYRPQAGHPEGTIDLRLLHSNRRPGIRPAEGGFV